MFKLNLFSLLLLASIGNSSHARALTDEQIRAISYTYPTTFGDLKFYDANDRLDIMAARIELNSKSILLPTSTRDGWGNTLSLMPMDGEVPNAIDSSQKKSKNIGRPMTKRLIVAEARDGNCIRQFLILDFTLSKPFISERFGDNPEMKLCLKLKNVKWGVKESRITLGDGVYIYRTGSEIIPPEEQ